MKFTKLTFTFTSLKWGRGKSLIYFVDDCLKIGEKNKKGHVLVCDKIHFVHAVCVSKACNYEIIVS